MNVIVIGGGASGLFAAIHAAQTGATVTIIEQEKKTGKKLSITGNGKCNFTNRNLITKDLKESVETYYYGEHDFIHRVFQQFGAEDTISFFRQIGICSYVEKNYNGLYPKSNQAGTVTQILTDYARELHVKIKTNNDIHHVSKTDQGFCVDVGIPIHCDRLILATGGYLPEIHGVSGYDIAKEFGHSIQPLKPALTALLGKSVLTGAAGVRIATKITTASGTVQEGEMQITDYGISGIPVFNLSHMIQDGEQLQIDFLPELRESEIQVQAMSLLSDWKAYRGEATIGQTLVGTLPPKLLTVILKYLNLSEKTKMKDVSKKEFLQIFETLKHFPFQVEKRRDFSYAQVTQGGVPCDEVYADSMESKKCKGLYLVGEIMDVDGVCGGYNLQWAWSTGYLAGVNSSK